MLIYHKNCWNSYFTSES